MLKQVLELRQFEAQVREIASWLDVHTPEYLPLDAEACGTLQGVRELRSRHDKAEMDSQTLVESTAQLLTVAKELSESGHYASAQLTSEFLAKM